MAPINSKPCGHLDCGVSTGIHEGSAGCLGLTFGRGDLDFNGYWEYGCSICARAHEITYPEDGPCWPFKDLNDVERILGKRDTE